MRIRLLVLCVALVFVTVSARWDYELVLSPAAQGIGTLAVLLAAALGARSTLARMLVDRIAEGLVACRRRHVVALAAVTTCAVAFLTYFVLEPFPHLEDSVAYYFQARVFATGRLFAQAPPLPDFFPSAWVITHENRWFGIFPPGWPLLLVIGMKAGVPALVNPVLGGLCVLAVYELIREMHGPRIAGPAVWFLIASPFFLFLSATLMSHTPLLLFATLSTLAQLKAMKAAGRRAGGWWVLSGVAAAVAFLIRPLDTLAVWGSQSLYALWTTRGRQLYGIAGSGMLLASGVAIYLGYNRVLTGMWFTEPLDLVGTHLGLGFGPEMGTNWETFDTPGHNLWRALLNMNFNMAALSQDLFGWPFTSLLFVLVLWTLGRTNPMHRLSAFIVAGVSAACALFWYHGVAFGPRLYFSLIPHVIALSVEGIRQAPEIVARLAGRDLAAVRRVVHLTVLMAFGFMWMGYMPAVSLFGRYYNYRGVNAGLYDFVEREGIRSGIVFVNAPRAYLFGPGLVANELPLGSGDVIYALDRGARNEFLVRMFRGRPVYHYTYQPEPSPYAAWLSRTLGRP